MGFPRGEFFGAITFYRIDSSKFYKVSFEKKKNTNDFTVLLQTLYNFMKSISVIES